MTSSSESVAQGNPTTRRRLASILLAAVTMFGLLELSGAAIKNQLAVWHILPQPDRLTELYFSSPYNLPVEYLPGSPQVVNFTVLNREYRLMDYTYQIVQQSDSSKGSRILARGSFTLGQGRSKNSHIAIIPQDLGQRVQTIVKLTNVNESINYWVTRSTT